jgi:Chlorite dismutase
MSPPYGVGRRFGETGYHRSMGAPRIVAFVGGADGSWRVEGIQHVTGETLPIVERLAVVEVAGHVPAGAAWVLRGVTSNERYATAEEHLALAERQESLGRPKATRAALIPIRKTEAWWDLSQDERRAIFEERSGHISLGLEYLPAVARRLHHSRDLGEPFDFLTWFEYAPEHADSFERLVDRLRQTEEWRYVEREVDIRLTRG